MRRFSAFFGLLVLFLLACSLPGLSRASATPTPTLEPVPVSEEAAQQFEEKLTQLGDVQPGEKVVLTITEEEITSYIAVNMAQSSDIQDLQVHFRNGRIYISGSLSVGPTTQPLSIVVRPYVEAGKMSLEFEEAKLGPLALPGALKETINTQIQNAVSSEEGALTIQSITVEDGTLTVEAIRKTP